MTNFRLLIIYEIISKTLLDIEINLITSDESDDLSKNVESHLGKF